MTIETTLQDDHDVVFEDDMGDGFPWTFAPDDSVLAERFASRAEAVAFADQWIASRG